jgi:hypothetical protein
LKTEPHFLAYFDIQGYKDIVHSCKDNSDTLLYVIKESISLTKRNIHRNNIFHYYDNEEIKVLFFSDNFSIHIKAGEYSAMF